MQTKNRLLRQALLLPPLLAVLALAGCATPYGVDGSDDNRVPYSKLHGSSGYYSYRYQNSYHEYYRHGYYGDGPHHRFNGFSFNWDR